MPRARTITTWRNERPQPSWVIASGPATSHRTTRSASISSHSGEIRPAERISSSPSPDHAIDDETTCGVPLMADHLDRFAIYRMRLEPLESVKQNPRYHPEGDALFHSLQVFQLARESRPYDEEFLLAALLHDVGKAIEPQDHAAAGVEALRGSVTERTLWLIEHHMDLLACRERPLSPRLKRDLEASEFYEDLKLLRALDDAGRVPGQPVESLEEGPGLPQRSGRRELPEVGDQQEAVTPSCRPGGLTPRSIARIGLWSAWKGPRRGMPPSARPGSLRAGFPGAGGSPGIPADSGHHWLS